MSTKLTLSFKKDICRHCDHCDKRAFQQKRNHCKSEFRPRNGHCENFKRRKEIKK